MERPDIFDWEACFKLLFKLPILAHSGIPERDRINVDVQMHSNYFNCYIMFLLLKICPFVNFCLVFLLLSGFIKSGFTEFRSAFSYICVILFNAVLSLFSACF